MNVQRSLQLTWVFFIARDLRELYSNRLNSHNNQNTLVMNIILKYNFYGLRTSVLP